MKTKLAFGAVTGLAAGVGLSAYQYFGPLDYVGLKAGLGLFSVNLMVGIAGGILGGLIWGRGRLGRALVAMVVCAGITAAWGYWNMRRDFNVVVLVADAVRADHVSAYGYHRETTPNWDALAESEGGVLFETAVAQGTVTISGGPALLTGLYQSQTDYVTHDYVLPEKIDTLAEQMTRLGYATYGMVSNPHLSAERGFAQGFLVFEDTLSWDKSPGAGRIAYQFTDWYENEQPRQMFAFLFFIDTHMPYRGPLEDVLRLRPEYKPVDTYWKTETMLACQGPQREDIVARYDGALVSVDRACGKVLDELERASALERTLVVIISDHGEAFWEHGVSGHGKRPYEHQVRIPLIMRFPSPTRFPEIRPVAHVCEHPAGQTDIMPTILRFDGVTVPAAATGESLLPYVFGRRLAHRDKGLLTEHLRPEYGYQAWRKGQYKLLVTEWRPGNSSVELYDLEADPEERTNLAAKEPELVAALRKEMQGELARAQVYAFTAEQRELGEEAKKRLKALGYLD